MKLNLLYKKFFGNEGLAKNIALLATGTLLGKAIGILGIPIITRVYSPADMGVLSTFVAISTLIIQIGTFKYAVALPLPKNDISAFNLAVGCFAILTCTTLISTISLWHFSETFFKALAFDSVAPYWGYIVLALFTTCSYEILNNWAVRKKSVKAIAQSSTWQSASGTFAKVIIGLIGFKPDGLLIGQVLTQAGGFGPLIHAAKLGGLPSRRSVSLRRIVGMLRIHMHYPKFRLPSQFLSIFCTQAPVLYCAREFGTETTGQLGLALTALTLPVYLVAHPVGQSYYAEIAKLGQKESKKILELTKKIMYRLFALSILPFILLTTLSPLVFHHILGPKWHEAAVFTQILAVTLVAQFISVPLVNALDLFEKQREFLKINITRTALVLTSLYFANQFNLSSKETMGVFGIVTSAHFAYTSYKILSIIKNSSYNR